jgi:signal transduction histidine kinase
MGNDTSQNQHHHNQQRGQHHGLLFQAALDYAELPLLILDNQKTVIAATTAACVIIGRSQAEIIGKPLAACGNGLFNERDPTTVELPLMALLQVSEKGPLAASSKAVLDSSGNTIGWIITMHAVTRPQIRKQRRMIPILPFLQPYFVDLQQILMHLPSLVMQPDDHQNTVIQMQRMLNEMILRVQRLVLLQSIESQGEVKLEEVQISTLIQHVLLEVRNKAKANRRNIRFNVAISELLSVIYCNSSQIRMALRELLENVIHHATGCSEVWIRLEQRQGYIHLSVHDNGGGIAQEQLMVFQDWAAQDEAGHHESFKHGGFGLALIRAVAKAHHGDLRVESVPGLGSTFTLVLPSFA